MRPRTTHNYLFICSLLLLTHPAHGQRQVHSRTLKPGLLVAKQACLPAQITVAKTVLCSGETLDLQSNILPSYRYRWFRDGSVLVGETSYLLTIGRVGTYRLEVTNTATAGCVQTTDITIRQSPLKSVSVVSLTPGAACEGTALVAAIDAGTDSGNAGPSTANLTYSWRRDGFVQPTTSPALRQATPGRYTVSVSDADCQVDAPPVEIYQRPVPVIASVPAICLQSVSSIKLDATPAGGIFSGKGVQNGQFVPGLAGGGQHTVTYSVTNAAGCRADTTLTIAVIDVPQPDLGPNQTIVAGTQVPLQGPAAPNLTYTWDPVAGLLTEAVSGTLGGQFNTPRVVAQPAQTTTYRLTVSNNNQCPLSAGVIITVLPGLFFPSAFTPNNDGHNDVWAFVGIEAFPQCRVRIYNRWGELILDKAPYNEPWDGRLRGETVPPGPYQYVVNPAPFLPERAGTLTVLE